MPSSSTNPLSPEQFAHVQAEVVREARRTLVARRFIGLFGPLGAGIESVSLERFGPDKNAELDLIGREDPDPIVPLEETYIRIPILFKDFVMHWRDVELSQKLGAPLDASRAIRLLFQPLLVAWALWCTGAWHAWRVRRRDHRPFT